MNTLFAIALKEFQDGLRNRWVLAITAVFALFALGIGYFGAAASGSVGFTSVATTVVSLATLAVFLVPLIALMLAYDSVVGEEERGTLLLLFTYPVSRTRLLAGKFLGHGLILALSTVVGFGAAGGIIAALSQQGADAQMWRAFGFFIASATLLGWSFVALAYLVSTCTREKSRAAGLALVVWFVFVLVFDLALLGVLVSTQGGAGRHVLPYLLLLNPADVFRVANLAGFEPARAYAGLASIATGPLFRPAILLGVLALWVGIPFALAAWRFQRREL